MRKGLNSMQTSCILTGIKLSTALPCEYLSGQNYKTLHPIFSLSSSELLALRFSITELSAIECALVLLATVKACGLLTENQQEPIERAFFKTPKALLVPTLDKALGILDMIRSLPPKKAESIQLTKCVLAGCNFDTIKTLVTELAYSLDFISRKKNAAISPEALQSNAAKTFMETLEEAEQWELADILVSKVPQLEKQINTIKAFNKPTTCINKESVAEVSLAIAEVVPAIEKECLEELALIHLFKKVLEKKTNVKVEGNWIGTIRYYTGTFVAPSILATAKKPTALDALRARVKAASLQELKQEVSLEDI